MTKLVGTQILFPNGGQTVISMSRDLPGPYPCPGFTIGPFGAFPPPQPGTSRWFRLKVVYFDENAGGSFHIQIKFSNSSTGDVAFDLPEVASGQGAANFHYSNWYKPMGSYNFNFNIYALFLSHAYSNNHAGIYSVILEAHDAYEPGTSSSYSYVVTVANNSPLALTTHDDQFIAPGSQWTTAPLGNGYLWNPILGTLSFYDLGTTHIDGDSSETYGCLIALQGYQYVGRYNANGRLNVTINKLLQASLAGMTITPVEIASIIKL